MISSLTAAHIRHIVLDIEGTTTPIAFVHEVLFAYARSEVRNYLAEHLDSEETRADLALLRKEQIADRKRNRRPPPLINAPRDAEIDSLVAYINWLIDQDRKSTALKSLQGKIWMQGYHDGTLNAQLFPDVAASLKAWHNADLKISIFSSGSTLAQKLMFGHTEAGDLSEFIESYFDTTTGSKTAIASYLHIASSLRVPTQEILFISDAVAELDAASTAGMQTLFCVRPGNAHQFVGKQQIIQSFDEISTSYRR